MGLALSALFGLFVLATPALFCVIPLNYLAVRFSPWLRSLVAALVPTILFVPLWNAISSEADATSAEMIEISLMLGCCQFWVGMVAAFLSARNHPVPELEVDTRAKDGVNWDGC